MKRFLLSFLSFLPFLMVGCYESEEPVDPEVPVIGSLTLSQEQMSVGAEGGEYSVDITTEYPYETKIDVDWITVSGGSCGTECCTLNFIVAKNDTTSEREGVITFFCDDYNLSASLTIVQEAGSEQGSGTSIPNNQIWYTSLDGAVVTPYAPDVFGANIVSNSYENGQGVMVFDRAVTQIGDDAFRDCTNLTTITIPDSVKKIGNAAFCDCSNLTNATIPNSVTSIGGATFSGCSSLTSTTIPDSVTDIGYKLFYNCGSLKSVVIGNSVTSIKDGTFCFCDQLTSITIPNSVTEIKTFAFSSCSSLTAFYGKFASEDNRCLVVDGALNAFAPAGLTEYTIPDNVTSIGASAFEYCSSLTSVTIPNSVTSIGNSAFEYCSSLTSVTIPNSVTSIGNSAFKYCSSLTSVTIPESVTSIGDVTFCNCSSLTSVIIPNSVTEIGQHAFMNCTNLENVTIGNSVTAIGWSAFVDCSNLIEVYCKPTAPPTVASNMLSGSSSSLKIYVPQESVEAYKSAQYWRRYSSEIVGYDF